MASLTAQELAGIHRTWKLVTADKRGNGVAIFMKLFAEHPEYKQLFKRLRDIPDDKLEKHPSMRAHGSTVLESLGILIDNLDETDTLVELLHINVENHFQRNLRYRHYEQAFDVILSCLQSALGAELDTDATNGWLKIIDTMKGIIKAKISALEKEETAKQQQQQQLKIDEGNSGNKMLLGVCAGLAVAVGAAFIVKNR